MPSRYRDRFDSRGIVGPRNQYQELRRSRRRGRPINSQFVITNAGVIAGNRDVARLTKRHGLTIGDCPDSLAIDDGENSNLFWSVGIEVAHDGNAGIRRTQRERCDCVVLRVIDIPGRRTRLVVRQVGKPIAIEVTLERRDIGWAKGCAAGKPESRGIRWADRSWLDEPLPWARCEALGATRRRVCRECYRGRGELLSAADCCVCRQCNRSRAVDSLDRRPGGDTCARNVLTGKKPCRAGNTRNQTPSRWPACQ